MGVTGYSVNSSIESTSVYWWEVKIISVYVKSILCNIENTQKENFKNLQKCVLKVNIDKHYFRLAVSIQFCKAAFQLDFQF